MVRIVKRIGKPGYMTWEQIKTLHEAGHIIGSHGLSHEILTNLNDIQIEEELAASKKTLERNLEIEVNTLFCEQCCERRSSAVAPRYTVALFGADCCSVSRPPACGTPLLRMPCAF